MTDLTYILGSLAIATNWAVVLAGMPHQVYKLFKSKSAQGFSVATFSLYLISFLFGLFYGISVGNQPLIIGNIPTVFFSAIILAQILYYNFKNKSKTAVA
jgi:uncharacterized protein with PQ loop repeat